MPQLLKRHARRCSHSGVSCFGSGGGGSNPVLSASDYPPSFFLQNNTPKLAQFSCNFCFVFLVQ